MSLNNEIQSVSLVFVCQFLSPDSVLSYKLYCI